MKRHPPPQINTYFKTKTMEWLKRNWLILVITLAVVIAALWLLKPKPDNELRKQFEKERKEYQQSYQKAQKRIEILRKDSIEIREKMRKDIEAYKHDVAALESEDKRLKKKHDKVNFTDSDIIELDSIRDRILSNLPQK